MHYIRAAFEGLEVTPQRMAWYCQASGLSHGLCVLQENHLQVFTVKIIFTRNFPNVTAAIPSAERSSLI